MGSGTSSSQPAQQRLSPFRVIAAGTYWRLFGSRRAGETLLRAAAGGDEQNRMLAGMSLVKAGRRSFDLIQKRIVSGQASPTLVRLLPDIDATRARVVLEEILTGESNEITEAARQSIELLDRMDELEGE